MVEEDSKVPPLLSTRTLVILLLIVFSIPQYFIFFETSSYLNDTFRSFLENPSNFNSSLAFATHTQKKNQTKDNKISLPVLGTVPPTQKEKKTMDNKISLPFLVRNKIFKVSYVTGTYDDNRIWFGLGAKPFKKCSYSNCVATIDTKEFETSDAGLFNMRHLEKTFPKHPPGQKWIMFIKESPIHEPSYTPFNGIFNATMTYSHKSDIMCNYTTKILVKRKVPLETIKNFASGKRKLVAIIVSNCWTQSKRMQYIHNLQKHIPVDMYGGCGNLTCLPRRSRQCDEKLGREYKFYLSFENSICPDYATEKFERPILYNMVPIVLGGYNYSTFFPSHSYIDVKDFKSPKDLAEHLKKLDKNDTLYNEYFDWKKSYELKPLAGEQCRLCEYLNKSYQKPYKVYERLDQFWTQSDCFSPEDFYKYVDKASWT